ncbi:ArpU family phage packaging/lysis transcriptional regulator [Weissella paramesenteroides]|uniref:ArpU family phage packaging/lysis transcriptional regulator n=1 Tax=Weissella paramesenteroides TaxID=1249 RepID=UPI003D36ADF6
MVLLDTDKRVLNKRATIANVREFFEKEWPTIRAQAHVSWAGTKSPVISGMPRASMVGNADDDKFSAHAQATEWVDGVIQACQGMTQPHRHFLELRYFKDMEWLDIEALTDYSTRRGEQIINEAFVMFAYGFIDTYDFRVWR